MVENAAQPETWDLDPEKFHFEGFDACPDIMSSTYTINADKIRWGCKRGHQHTFLFMARLCNFFNWRK